MLHIAGIDYESVKDGEGVRTTIYVSGCSHNCYNCHNPQTHDINYGVPFTEELQNEIIENIKKRPFISGLTLSGGDPLHENHLDEVLRLVNAIRVLFPEKTIWLYTGYSWREIFDPKSSMEYQKVRTIKEREIFTLDYIKRQAICSACDVVVDGKYVNKLRDITLKWRGSTNQRVIDVQESLKQNQAVLYCD